MLTQRAAENASAGLLLCPWDPSSLRSASTCCAVQGEISILSCEPLTTSSSAADQQQPDSSSSGSNSITQDASQHSTSRSGGGSNSGASSASLVVSLFEVPYTSDNVAAFIQREHEFRFLAVQPYDLAGKAAAERLAVSACSCAGVPLAVLDDRNCLPALSCSKWPAVETMAC